jgi:hypothetical protein
LGADRPAGEPAWTQPNRRGARSQLLQLENRVEKTADKPPSSGHTFVELPSPVGVGKQSLSEPDNVEVDSGQLADVLTDEADGPSG